MVIDLTSHERLILLDALMHPAYKDKISLPRTKFIVRQTYRGLIAKLTEDETLSRKIRETIPGKKVILPGKEN